MSDEKVYCEGSDLFADGLKFVGDKQVGCPKCGKGISIKANGKLRSHVPGEGVVEDPVDNLDDNDDEETENAAPAFDFNKASRRASGTEAIGADLVAPVYGEFIPRPVWSIGQQVRIVRGQKSLIGKIGTVKEHDRAWGFVTFKNEDGKFHEINDWDVEDFKVNETNQE